MKNKFKIKQYVYRIIDELFTRRHWSENDTIKYIGYFDKSFTIHSAFEDTRKNAASGGVVSEILIYCLDNKIIEGALVCKSSIVSGKVRPAFIIATNKEEVLSSQGSKYIATRFLSEALPLIKSFKGTLAVVGLPCDLQSLSMQIKKYDELSHKIQLKIGLFCGHNSEKALIDNITKKLEKKAGARLTDFKFRIGLWRGMIEAVFENGGIIRKKTNLFTNFQNLFFFAQKKCFFCNDHFAYKSDISAGDIWSFHLKDSPIKHSGIITRDRKFSELIYSMIKNNSLLGNEIEIEEILNGQSRGIKLHHNLTVKSEIGRRFGVKIYVPDKLKESYKWHEKIVAWIVFFNWRLSQGKKSHLIFKIPKPFLKIYLYIMKGMQSLR